MSRKTEIIKESAKIIGNLGIQSFTTKKLASEIGISEAALYRHYSGKSEIIFAVFDYFEKMFVEKIQVILESNESPKKQIFDIFFLHKDIFKAYPELVFLFFSEGSFIDIEGLDKKITEMLQHKFNLISELVEKGQKSGQINDKFDSYELSKLMMGYFRIYLLQLKLEKNMDNLDRYCDNFFETIDKLL